MVTLLIIAVISVFVLTAMQHLLLYHKVINRQEQVHERFYQLEAVALQLAQMHQLPLDLHCITHEDSANQSIKQLVHHQGCFLNAGELTYQYFIEDLGEFPCLIANKKGTKQATHHWRISVGSMNSRQVASLLQIRFITLGANAVCVKAERSVSLGISSWRYLASV